MISMLENETIDNVGTMYEKHDGTDKYELKISSGAKRQPDSLERQPDSLERQPDPEITNKRNKRHYNTFKPSLGACEATLTGLHSSNSSECYTCYNINKFKNITNDIENTLFNIKEETNLEDLVAGKQVLKNKKRNDGTDKGKQAISAEDFLEGNEANFENVNSKTYEIGSKIFTTLKNKNIKLENLSDEVMNAIKALSTDSDIHMQTQYHDIYQIVLNMFRNYKESNAYSINKHPLIRLTMDSENSEVVNNFMKTVSMISNASRVNEFHKKIKYQSFAYEGIQDLENRMITFGSENSINAILFTFAACKLAYFENVAVLSSSDTLLLQLYNKKKIIKSDNFALAVSRYSNIENELKSTSFGSIVDNELKRINAHLMFKNLTLNIRMGNFDVKDTRELESYILGLKNNDMNMQFDVSEEENYLRSFFNIFGFNPILVRKNTLINNIYPIKAVPFLPINATQKLGTIDNPIKLASDMNLMINFDSLNNKIQITPSYKNTRYLSESNMTGILGTMVNPASNAIYFNQVPSMSPTPLLINGTMIYAINRISVDLLNRRGVGELSYIYNKDITLDSIDYDEYMTANLDQFDLQAIVCYKLENQLSFYNSRYASSIGFTSYIKTGKDTFFCYDDCMNLTAQNREAYEDRMLKNYFAYKVGGTVAEYDAWRDTSDTAKKLKEDFKKNQFNYYTFIFSADEVKEIAMRTGYLFIYSMEYNEYMKTKEVIKTIL